MQSDNKNEPGNGKSSSPGDAKDSAKDKPVADKSTIAKKVIDKTSAAKADMGPSADGPPNDAPADTVSAPSDGGGKALLMWFVVLLVYLSLLGSIGFISFWDQDFNKPENTIGAYLNLLDAKSDGASGSTEYTPAVRKLIDEKFKDVIQEVMKNNADAAGDLQELASQSFNIILGAILAFLSATATMVFQKLSGGLIELDKKARDKDKPKAAKK